MDFKKKIDDILSSKSKKAKLLTLLALIGICLIATASFFPSNKKNPKNNNENENEKQFFKKTNDEYVNELEKKIDSMVSHIEGVGNSKVTITMENGIENIYANSEKKTSNSNENISGNPTQRNDTQRDVVLVDGNNGKQALIVTQKEPTVKGVVVVCQGADNDLVRKRVTDAVSKTLNIKTNRLSVVKGNPMKNKIKHKTN